MIRNLTRQLFVLRVFSSSLPMSSRFYYAVTRGFTPGIYQSYDQVLEQVTGYDHATFKKFDTYEAAYKHFYHTQHDDVIKKEKATEEYIKKLKAAAGREKATKTNVAPSSTDSSKETSSTEYSGKRALSPSLFCQILNQDSPMGDNSNQTSVLDIEDQTLFLHFEEDEPVVSEPVRKSARLETRQSIKFVDNDPDDDNDDEYTLEDFERDILEIAGICKEKVKTKQKNIKRPGRPAKRVFSSGETGDMFNKDGVPIIYTDGCCTHANLPESQRRAGCGVFWGQRDPRNITERLWGPQTNQRAELWAVIRGVQSAVQSDYKSVEIRTDSRYVVEGMTSWIHTWKKNNWKTRGFQPVKNKELFVLLDNLCMYIDVNFVKVKGHSKDVGNDMADMLAKLGANLMEQKSPTFQPSETDNEINDGNDG